MSQKKVYIIIGFMLFALFFGAANLIYPAILGLYSGNHLFWAILGFCLTGVSLPLLGVLAISKSGSKDVKELAMPIAKWFAFVFSALLYLSIGPFFAIPRTGATSYAVGIAPLLGDSISHKIVYALFFFGLSYYLAIKPNQLSNNIGKYLTPTLLVVITILVIASFIQPAGPYGQAHNAGLGINNAFKDFPFMAGLIQGYGTMDALASLVFSILVIQATKQFGAKSDKDITRITIISGLIAITLLAIVYIFIGRIGATSQSLFTFKDGLFISGNKPINGGQLLSHTSAFYLGGLGQTCLAILIFLACLTTSTGLISSSASFFHELQPRWSQVTWASIFTLISASFYLGGLDAIVKWSTPVLFLLYPITIALIFLVLLQNVFHKDPLVFKTTIFMTMIPALFDAISTLSKMTGLFSLPTSLNQFFLEIVPLGQFSLGWISFAIIGFLLGLCLRQLKK